MTIDITNIINITVTDTPQGLGTPNINSLGFFSTETPSNIDPFRSYISASAVATDFGSNSVAAQFANNIFSQSPNILSGDGRLVIIPLINAVSAVQGIYTSADLTTNLVALQAIANGDIRITVDGVNNDLTLLDFTNASSLADIATILQKKLVNVIVVATPTGFILKSKKVGSASTVTMVQLPAGTGTDLSTAPRLNAAGGVAVAGGNAQGETILSAIARTEQVVEYYGFITDLQMQDALISPIAASIQAKDKIFIHQFSSTTDLTPATGICSIVKDANQTHTRCLFYSVDLESANLMKAAYAGRAFSVNFYGSNTTQTMNLKTLTNVLPDLAVDQTVFDLAEVAGADVYGSINSLACVISNGANDYFDNVYNIIWFKLDLTVNGFNYLKQTNTKIPQNEAGMDGLKGAYTKSAMTGINNLMLSAGLTWNSAETFGNPEDLRRNITDVGYYIYSQPIAQQLQAQREARIAPLVQIAIKLAGAIHSSDVLVVIQR